MKLLGLLLGALAILGFALQSIPNDDWIMPDFGIGGPSPSHRSAGGRAHRRWRKLRSSGRL